MTEARTWIAVVGAIVTWLLLDWAMKFWMRSQDRARRSEAQELLRARSMEAHLYLPSFGAGDESLRAALTVFDHTGYIVLNRDGVPVGRVLPKVGPQQGLRLVVDNSK